MLFSCNQSLVKSQHVVSAVALTTQPQSRHHPDIKTSSTFFQNPWLPSRCPDNLLHPSLPLTSLLIPISLFCVVCLICIFLPLAIGGSSRVEVEMLLLRTGTQQRHRYRGASGRQQQLRAATAQRRANKRQMSPPNSNGRSGAAAGTAARSRRRDRGLDRGRSWPRRQPTSACKALERKGNLGGKGNL